MPPPVPPLRPNELIETLTRHRVELVVIGGMAAVLQGAPYSTFDVDIVYRRSADNLDRLQAALDELDAELHDPTERHLAPTRELLEQPGPKLLRTRFGRLDLLGELEPGQSWEQVLDQAVSLPYRGRQVDVLALEQLIARKERLGRDKDRAALPLLRATLARAKDGGKRD